MKALITGITGFVGSHLAELLIEKGVEVYGFARWRSPMDNIEHIKDKIKMYYGDLLDYPSVYACIFEMRQKLVDYIFHLGAQSYVPYSFIAPVSTLDINGIGTCNLLEAIRRLHGKVDIDKFFVPVVHICSSSEVYGQVREEDVPITEDCPLRPASPYGISKVCEDLLALNWNMLTILFS